ncbi:MAG: hypothetical protein KatS3mg077_2612 [Candidatus Binatia bacterium]|nr:MAG: hypothetical protein KatS3mg077_2612 [Candidatus Binatia bacterium]
MVASAAVSAFLAALGAYALYRGLRGPGQGVKSNAQEEAKQSPGGLQFAENQQAPVMNDASSTAEAGGDGRVAISARRLAGNRTEITYSDGTVEVREGGTVSWRNNNPGNIGAGEFANRHGAIGIGANGRPVFPSEQSGRRALIALLRHPNYQSLSLEGAIARYDRENAVDYVRFVTKWLGLPGATPMSSVNVDRLADAITVFEGWRPGKVTVFGGQP